MIETRYGALLADPPWLWQAWGPRGEGRSAKQHYSVMTLNDIKALQVKRLAAPDCVLFLWVVDSMLPQALDVLQAWEFTFKTVAFTWKKTTITGKDCFGGGYWTRKSPEQCWLATRGHPKRLHADVRQLIEAPRRAHSQKPDEIYARIERLVAGPWCELFARQRWPGWDALGDAIDGRDLRQLLSA